MVYGGDVTIIPGDHDCIPAYFGDTAAVSGIALPINAATPLEAFRFGAGHRPHSSFCIVIIRGLVSSCAFGFALRGFFLSLSLFLLASSLRCTAAICALPTVIRLESH
jgi:hypothetical protein